ncbi:myotubularin-related protein 1-like [Gracilinanus agilis]|uniref:myotubularin-related protein 1-like n=1 Tax=Gracilinanus agilis TaxID=191870 RepID=UPI001CFF1EEA|nr:myotubularin-related protein 1-like [Gracilinanus agilis]
MDPGAPGADGGGGLGTFGATRRPPRPVGALAVGSRQPSVETLDSPTGSHVEWCKQLIAATISSQISGSVPAENISRDYRVSNLKHLIIPSTEQDWPTLSENFH